VDSLLVWVPTFIAGAAGGFVLELIKSRWTMELPSTVPSAQAADPLKPDDSGFGDPVGPRIDLGFLGRIATSALAAPVALILLNVPGDSAQTAATLAATATRLDTLALAVVIGFAAPAIWTALEAMVVNRIKALQDKQKIIAALIEEKAEVLKSFRPQSAAFSPDEQKAISEIVGSLQTAARTLRSG
jgi:hypothetical protein